MYKQNKNLLKKTIFHGMYFNTAGYFSALLFPFNISLSHNGSEYFDIASYEGFIFHGLVICFFLGLCRYVY